MRVTVHGKNIAVTEAIKSKIERKLARLDKFFIIDDSVEAKVLISVEPQKQKIEVTIPTKFAILRSEVSNYDLYTAIDDAVDKLEDQIRRQKTRLSRRGKASLAQNFIDEVTDIDEGDDIYVRTKSIRPEPLDLDEAIMRMEMLQHTFFIYRDLETQEIAVVYKRKDGGYGVIECE